MKDSDKLNPKQTHNRPKQMFEITEVWTKIQQEKNRKTKDQVFPMPVTSNCNWKPSLVVTIIITLFLNFEWNLRLWVQQIQQTQ